MVSIFPSLFPDLFSHLSLSFSLQDSLACYIKLSYVYTCILSFYIWHFTPPNLQIFSSLQPKSQILGILRSGQSATAFWVFPDRNTLEEVSKFCNSALQSAKIE
ncbi:hypothetical protein KSP40_PGU008093 [Platanthera guangdongensis]|uniref:Uncharacterized protein n=1 Tax=Platanthera guangdongensis TaxID=2320717 RepID=A0ABR2MYQ8_9ASPA